MKRQLSIIIASVISVATFAQNPDEAFYIYRNDGGFHVFFRSEIDSMVYSCYDMENVRHDRLMTQHVYMKDSVCRIPLAVIDSITLVPFGSASDEPKGLSAQAYIRIPIQPSCAMVNISGISSMPTKKGTDAHAWMEVWDMRGVYFKKKILVDLNGDSSTAKEKKNFAVDFCEDDWIGDETTQIKIGDWVTQDGFHFKANYTSITKGESPICYKLYDKFMTTKPRYRRAPFMDYYSEDYLMDIFNGSDEEKKEEFSARCYPDGFPCVVFLNGKFYGIYSWQLKKHRDNFHLKRNEVDNIHLDGILGPTEFWNGEISWGGFEVRNPKPKKSKWTLMCQDGTEYNGDKPKELMGMDSKFYDASDKSCVNSAKTKAQIVSLSNYISEISEYEVAWKNASDDERPTRLDVLKREIEKRFSMEYMIDYLILQLLIQNGDCVRKNWQWTTWGEIDGKTRWYVNPYDLDHAFGVLATTAFTFHSPGKATYGKGTLTPARYVWDYYLDDMKMRYAELRNADVISYNTIFGLVNDWVSRVGAGNYQREAEQWPNMPCNRDAYISNDWKWTGKSYISYFDGANTNGWSKTRTFASGAYTKYNYRCYLSLKDKNVGHIPDEEDSEWWQDVTISPGQYKKGDMIFDGRCNFYQFQALADIEVTKDESNNDRQDHLLGTPFEKFYPYYLYEGGTHDSVERISTWIQKKIELMDDQMGYPKSVLATSLSVEAPETLFIGETYQLSPSCTPSEATVSFKYSVEDASVASVTSDGLISAVGKGTTNVVIIETISGLVKSVVVNVADPNIPDLTGDNEVTIADVTALVNIILGKTDGNISSKIADVNKDGNVSIADVTALVNIILGKM